MQPLAGGDGQAAAASEIVAVGIGGPLEQSENAQAAQLARQSGGCEIRQQAQQIATSETVDVELRALTTLLIDAGSMSMWILRDPGQNSSSLPVTRSSNLAPTQTTRSAWCIARFASTVPCIPSMPTKRRSEAGNAPSPSSVSVHGASMRRTIEANSAQALGPELISPPPP